MGEEWKQWQTWCFGAPKSLQMVTAAMKLKDTCSLEKKLWPTLTHIKNQKHYFANKSPSSQSHGFSSSHVWMWKLDCKESWVPKNWCFWTVVLEKNLESPLDSKEIQLVNPKGNSVQFSSVAQSCLTLCDPMNPRMSGLPVYHQLPESTQTHVHWVGDVIQPSHPLSSPSPPAPNSSQHQSLYQRVNSSYEVAKVLEFQLYHHSFQRTLSSLEGAAAAAYKQSPCIKLR